LNNKKPLLPYYKFLINKIHETYGKDDVYNQNLLNGFEALNQTETTFNNNNIHSFNNVINNYENFSIPKPTNFVFRKLSAPAQSFLQKQNDDAINPNATNDTSFTMNISQINSVTKSHKQSLTSSNLTIPLTPVSHRENKTISERLVKLSMPRSTKKQIINQINDDVESNNKENNHKNYNQSTPFPYQRKSTLGILHETKDGYIHNPQTPSKHNDNNNENINECGMGFTLRNDFNNKAYEELEQKYQSLQKEFNEYNEKSVFQQKENETKEKEWIERVKNFEIEISTKNDIISNLQQQVNQLSSQLQLNSNNQRNNNNGNVNNDDNHSNDKDPIVTKIGNINFEHYIQNNTLSELRVVELRDFLKANHINTNGVKSDLIDRIIQYYNTHSH